MKIGIVSDSHDHIPNIKRAVEHFNKQGISMILHAGDYCSPFTIPFFKGMELTGVFGNNDGDHYRILQKFGEINGDMRGEFADLEFYNRRIALYHGTQQGITDSLVLSETYDLVITGHTHQPHVTIKGNTTWLNPGSLHGFDDFGTAAVYDTLLHKAEIFNI